MILQNHAKKYRKNWEVIKKKNLVQNQSKKSHKNNKY